MVLIAVAALAGGPAEASPGMPGAPGPRPLEDPRLELAVLRPELEGDPAAAATLLERVDALLVAKNVEAKAAGFDYLRARLIAESGTRAEAIAAFTESLAGRPALLPWARYHLAAFYEADGKNEVAAGQIAAVLAARPGRPLLEKAVVLLARTVAGGGDCRLLSTLPALQLKPEEQRYLAFARAECAHRAKRVAEAEAALVALLRTKVEDDPALLAAERLAQRLDPAKADARTLLLVGTSFYEHRDFVAAIPFLNVAIGRLVSGRDVPAASYWQARYALARSLFWLERHGEAAAAFDALGRASSTAGERAQAFYQKARSLELQALDPAHAALFDEAAAVYGEVIRLVPEGRWGNAASISKSRIDWLQGREGEALVQLEGHLAKKRPDTAAQILDFLIATDLSRGKTERPAIWIPLAERLGKSSKLELLYWKARLNELKGQKAEAIEQYLRVWQQAPYDPVAQQAWQRLQAETLQPTVEKRARQLARSESTGELTFAWRFLGDTDTEGVLARTALVAQLLKDPRSTALLRLAPRPAADWPMWKVPLQSGEELLAGLGLFDDSPGIAGRFFPLTDPTLGLAGSRALAAAGAHHKALYLAETLARRSPPAMPAALLPKVLRERAYPLGYRLLLDKESRLRKIDPQLLAAIIREESRFDPEAFSPASARGLTQFIFPTAQKLAEKLGLPKLTALDLHRPQVSIALGAAYLAELQATFGGNLPPMVAAYNAGAPQARLWKRYCVSDDAVEYLSKVGFEETRNYLTKVLTSRAHYREIYGLPETEASARPVASPGG